MGPVQEAVLADLRRNGGRVAVGGAREELVEEGFHVVGSAGKERRLTQAVRFEGAIARERGPTLGRIDEGVGGAKIDTELHLNGSPAPWCEPHLVEEDSRSAVATGD